jgi:hypothetical protein
MAPDITRGSDTVTATMNGAVKPTPVPSAGQGKLAAVKLHWSKAPGLCLPGPLRKALAATWSASYRQLVCVAQCIAAEAFRLNRSQAVHVAIRSAWCSTQ